MIIHHHGRFSYDHHATFSLPNGMALNDAAEGSYENRIELIAPDKSFRLVISFFRSDKDAETFLQEAYDELRTEGKPAPEIRAIETPMGLHGYTTTYDPHHEIYEEYVIELPGEPRALLNFWFWRRKDEPYDAVLYSSAKIELLAGIF